MFHLVRKNRLISKLWRLLREIGKFDSMHHQIAIWQRQGKKLRMHEWQCLLLPIDMRHSIFAQLRGSAWFFCKCQNFLPSLVKILQTLLGIIRNVQVEQKQLENNEQSFSIDVIIIHCFCSLNATPDNISGKPNFFKKTRTKSTSKYWRKSL